MDQMPYSNNVDLYNDQPQAQNDNSSTPSPYTDTAISDSPAFYHRPADAPLPADPRNGAYWPTQQSGSVPPMSPAPSRKKPSGMVIAGVVLTVIELLASVIAGGSNLPSHRSTTQPGHPTSAFQSAPCPFQLGADIVDGQQVTCGYINVPENRNVNDGRKVKLALAIFKAPQYLNTPDPDPVLRLDGGPGGPSLDTWAQAVTALNYNRIIFDHDLIMFDQRGTGYSTPSLACP